MLRAFTPSQLSGSPLLPPLSDTYALGRVERPRSTAADQGGQPYPPTGQLRTENRRCVFALKGNRRPELMLRVYVPCQLSGLPLLPPLSDTYALGRVERPRSTAADQGGQPYPLPEAASPSGQLRLRAPRLLPSPSPSSGPVVSFCTFAR